MPELNGAEAPFWKFNPEYEKATHLVLWIHPDAPSFDEQIQRDQEFTEQLKNKDFIEELEKKANSHSPKT